LYVSSYHTPYDWNDAIEGSLETTLEGKCELRKFYMDGKRNLGEDFAKKKALEAKQLIDSWKPDVVIAADDNASKYLVMPYLKDAPVPVVFCGINWTAEYYGYPYSNATGMIEVGPIDRLANEVISTVRNAKRGVFLSADEMTQYKEVERSREAYGKHGISIDHLPVRSMADWEAGYRKAQEADFLIIGNNAGINDWDDQRAAAFALENAGRFTVAYLEWMAPYAMLTMAKIAEEQGEWAGKAAVMILSGTSPRAIPIVANRRWNMYANLPQLDKTGHRLSQDVLLKAVRVGE
ncbi:MAG: hypothetical protein IH608_10850, partial [Proteobacteria bacterium]|nr:hypothetical protein [Pseudomonadota bacterium]